MTHRYAHDADSPCYQTAGRTSTSTRPVISTSVSPSPIPPVITNSCFGIPYPQPLVLTPRRHLSPITAPRYTPHVALVPPDIQRSSECGCLKGFSRTAEQRRRWRSQGYRELRIELRRNSLGRLVGMPWQGEVRGSFWRSSLGVAAMQRCDNV
jgi:hypothetical protein